MPRPEDRPPPRKGENPFGQLIAARRRQLGLSQHDLAELLCEVTGRPTLTRHEISRYERGVRLPGRWVLAAMASSLDLTIAVLRQAVGRQRERALRRR